MVGRAMAAAMAVVAAPMATVAVAVAVAVVAVVAVAGWWRWRWRWLRRWRWRWRWDPHPLAPPATHCGAGGGVEGERMPGVKKHRVVPRPEGVIGIRDSGDGHTPVTTKALALRFDA